MRSFRSRKTKRGCGRNRSGKYGKYQSEMKGGEGEGDKDSRGNRHLRDLLTIITLDHAANLNALSNPARSSSASSVTPSIIWSLTLCISTSFSSFSSLEYLFSCSFEALSRGVVVVSMVRRRCIDCPRIFEVKVLRPLRICKLASNDNAYRKCILLIRKTHD